MGCSHTENSDMEGGAYMGRVQSKESYADAAWDSGHAQGI
jgi:hypothetical protein